jgi:hypothetical protein
MVIGLEITAFAANLATARNILISKLLVNPVINFAHPLYNFFIFSHFHLSHTVIPGLTRNPD